ncbi:unnamed protein product [Owenia fusiformis]|uniref:Urea-proton symporter DUR3 n=1 Tax=Owenia fusiformis TaxID=6347 RepID=A0A8S4NAP6_OWEFU|nr:unnamed protein product [Owenia fusiformis]
MDEGLKNIRKTGTVTSSIELRNAVLLIVGFGLISMIIAAVFRYVRKTVFHDKSNLDTTFDAGGKVSIGLTATTLVSQMTWAASFMQSVTVAVQYGISGAFWYGASVSCGIFLFAILSIHLKTKSPGAKTFLQVIRVRFGKATHIVFCVFAGITNILVTLTLLLAGSALLESLILDMSIELACMLMAFVIGSYTLIGGLGATFYVSYVNTSLVFCFMIVLIKDVFLNDSTREDDLPIGSADKMFVHLINATGPVGNYNESFLTMLSPGSLMFGITVALLTGGAVVCDQSFWQSSIAAKPSHGVWGFVAAGLTWFAIPFVMATTFGLAYIAIEEAQGEPLLSQTDVFRGLALPRVAQILLGTTGEYLTFLMVLMAIMSTGSAEVIAVSSLIVYDIYQPYVNPFRKQLDESIRCLLCGKMKFSDVSYNDQRTNEDQRMRNECKCQPVFQCSGCANDEDSRHTPRKSKLNEIIGVPPPYSCKEHGRYHEYQDHLITYKNFCIIWVTTCTIPLVLCANWIGLDLAWVFLAIGIPINCATVPVILSVTWSKATYQGMISGVVCGCVCGISVWLIISSTYEGGLADFLKNTGRPIPTLVGSGVSMLMGGLVCIVVSICTLNRELHNEEQVWGKLQNIENPLHPWAMTYAHEFGKPKGETGVYERPTQKELRKQYKKPFIIVTVSAIGLSIGFFIIWPAVMLPIKVMNQDQFRHWINLTLTYAFIAAAFIIIVPLVQEIYSIVSKARHNKKKKVHLSKNKHDIESPSTAFLRHFD